MFRPVFEPLFEDEERQDILAPTASPARPQFPVAISLPVIRPWNSNIEIRKSVHAPKTLLGYHYRFNAQASRGWSGENYLIRDDQAPYIDIAWGLAIDKSESTATGSPHTHTRAWPCPSSFPPAPENTPSYLLMASPLPKIKRNPNHFVETFSPENMRKSVRRGRTALSAPNRSSTSTRMETPRRVL